MPPSKRFMELTDSMRDIHKRKNAGYAGDCNDPWANFRYSELFGIPAFKGCLVRLSDKFIRIANLTKNPKNEQVGEAITDTLLDLANYAVIAICLYEESIQQGKPTGDAPVDLEEYIIKTIELNQKKEEKEEVNARSGNAGKDISQDQQGPILSKETNIQSSPTYPETKIFSRWGGGMG